MDLTLKYEAIINERDVKIKSNLSYCNRYLVLTETNLQCLSKIREQEQLIRLNVDLADQLKN